VRQALCATLLYALAAVLQAAPGAAVVLPALTDPASGEHHVGKVVWADLLTPDLGAAKRFYGALFGWTFRDVPGDPNYTLVLLDGEPLAGLFQKALPPGQASQPAWLTFLAVNDVNTALDAARQHGGHVRAHSGSDQGSGVLASRDCRQCARSSSAARHARQRANAGHTHDSH
jgi:predicted enzyme related to lactoylglutathione lyase